MSTCDTATGELIDGEIENAPFQQDRHEKMAKQLTDIVSIDCGLPAHQLDQEVENLLAKIAEYVEVIENIRSDTKISVNTTLPRVTEKALDLETTFNRIDALEVMVANINETLTQLERQADHAESHLNSFASLKKKFFGALSSIGRKHQDTSPRYRSRELTSQAPQYHPVEIFNTSDYLTADTSTS